MFKMFAKSGILLLTVVVMLSVFELRRCGEGGYAPISGVNAIEAVLKGVAHRI